jgi:hypothetical protein
LDEEPRLNDLWFIWWNVQDFAHFDPDRLAEAQWPSSAGAFTAKVDLVAKVLGDHVVEQPVVIGLAETTREAAEALRDRILPDYSVLSLDLHSRSELNVAFIYPDASEIRARPPFAPAHVPRGTRPMAVLDVMVPNHTIRFYGCHWTARFSQSSERTRSEIARQLARNIFEYFASTPADQERHVIVMGDLNEEPFGLLERDLWAQRERHRANRAHWSDKDVYRRYLYNTTWRLVGERAPHTACGPHSAGTYYWAEQNEWRTFDHVIVDGSLVAGECPMLDEATVEVLAHSELFRAGRTPEKFWWNGKVAMGGVSDHLPIKGKLVLRGYDE